MNNDTITLNETLKLHEISMFKVLCANKASALEPLVQDEELKKLLKEDVQVTKKHINEIKELLQKSPLIKEQDI